MAREDYDRLLIERLEHWQPDVRGTLLFLLDDDRVLLIRKKRGHGAGKINGPGGKIDPGETPLEAALRETHEETGVRVRGASLAAEFRFLELSDLQWYGYVFLAREWEGTPVETAEALPFWCAVDELPFDDMWEDDRLWLPRVLAGERLRGDFLFDDGRLLAHRLGSLEPTLCP
jgi:8-oxo-dGTP diphosphatase